jgi:hypothetical protein
VASEIVFKPDFKGVCVCGRKFFIDTRNFAVGHELPMCEKFRVLEPDKFLRYVRETTTGVTDN